MANISVTTADWSIGTSALSGLTRFAWFEITQPADRQNAVDRMRSFFFSTNLILRTDFHVQVRQTVETFDAVTGTLVGEAAAPTLPSVVNGTVATTVAYAAGTGVRVKWNTGQIAFGHHVSGRTFICPTAGAHDTDGTANPTAMNAMNAAIAGILNGGTAIFAIWSRKWDRSDPTKPPKQIDGQPVAVISGVAVDKATSLRSRRQ